jgi:hypothetical protein
MAQLSRTPAQGFEMTYHAEDFMAEVARAEAALAQLEAVSAALPEGEIVGGLISFPRGDGRAIYRVTKANPLTLQHVPFMDAWEMDAATIRGLRRIDVERMLHGTRAMRAAFANKAPSTTLETAKASSAKPKKRAAVLVSRAQLKTLVGLTAKADRVTGASLSGDIRTSDSLQPLAQAAIEAKAVLAEIFGRLNGEAA